MKLHSPHPILDNVHTPKTMPAESQEVTNPQQATPWLSDHSQNTREFVLGIEHKLAYLPDLPLGHCQASDRHRYARPAVARQVTKQNGIEKTR